MSTISKRNLDEDTLKLLQRLARKKKNPAVREKQNSFLLTGGDNVAESLVQVGKKQLRRLSQLGGAKDRLEHRNLLAAYYIHKNPGLDSVLNALRLHREKTSGMVLSLLPTASNSLCGHEDEKGAFFISSMVLQCIITYSTSEQNDQNKRNRTSNG